MSPVLYTVWQHRVKQLRLLLLDYLLRQLPFFFQSLVFELAGQLLDFLLGLLSDIGLELAVGHLSVDFDLFWPIGRIDVFADHGHFFLGSSVGLKAKDGVEAHHLVA